MIITLVIDQYDDGKNGTTMTAKRLAETLTAHGNEVRILGGECKGSGNFFVTGVNKTPILYQVCRSQGMIIAKANKKVIKEACDGADVVHFLLPFKLEREAKKYCDENGIKTTAAFHVQPENISSTIGLRKIKMV